MNEAEIDRAVERFVHPAYSPVLRGAAKFLAEFRDEVNAHSDGWVYWKAPARAAGKLMAILQDPSGATVEDVRRALIPIKAFYTRKGIKAGMQFPTVEVAK